MKEVPDMKLLKPVMIFGDSIMKGVVLNREEERYHVSHELGVEELADRFGLKVENRSRFGCTVDKGFMLLRRALEKEPDCAAVVLEYGGNDCDFDWAQVAQAPEAEHEPHSPLERFTATYESMIAYLRERNVLPILTTLPPLCAERYLNWVCRAGLDKAKILSWLGDVNAIYRYHERYSRRIEQLAEKYGLPLVDLRAAFLEQRQMEAYFCEDGIHPNEKGQRLIHDAFSRYMAEKGLTPA